MHFLSCIYGVLILNHVIVLQAAGDTLRNEQKPEPLAVKDGVEFSGVSRGALLKILAALDESVRGRYEYRGKKRPVYTTHFANNPYTHKFVYPQIYRTNAA